MSTLSHVLERWLIVFSLIWMNRGHHTRVGYQWRWAAFLYACSIWWSSAVRIYDGLVWSLYLFAVVLRIIKMLVHFVRSFNCRKLDSNMWVYSLDIVKAYNDLFWHNFIESRWHLALWAPRHIWQNHNLVIFHGCSRLRMTHNFSASKVLGCFRSGQVRTIWIQHSLVRCKLLRWAQAWIDSVWCNRNSTGSCKFRVTLVPVLLNCLEVGHIVRIIWDQ